MILIERRPTRGGQSGENPDRERHLRQLGTDSARLFASFLFFRAERTCKLEQELVEMIWARVKSLLRAPSRATQALDALIEGSANEQSILQTQLTSINERLDTIIDKLGTLSSATNSMAFRLYKYGRSHGSSEKALSLLTNLSIKTKSKDFMHSATKSTP